MHEWHMPFRHAALVLVGRRRTCPSANSRPVARCGCATDTGDGGGGGGGEAAAQGAGLAVRQHHRQSGMGNARTAPAVAHAVSEPPSQAPSSPAASLALELPETASTKQAYKGTARSFAPRAGKSIWTPDKRLVLSRFGSNFGWTRDSSCTNCGGDGRRRTEQA